MFQHDDEEDGFAFRDGESFNGGIARWAAANWVERMMDLTRVAGVEWGHRQTASAAPPSALSALAEEMGIEVGELVARSMPLEGGGNGRHARRWFNGLLLPATLLETRVRRYAPDALRMLEGDHHRALWDLRLLPVCTKTGQILLDRCQNPDCDGRRLGWQHTMGVDRCEHCMADLTTSHADTIPDELRRRLAPIADLFVRERRQEALDLLPPDIGRDGGLTAVELLLRLMPVADPALGRDAPGRATIDPVGFCQALALSWEMMSGWPGAFVDYALARVLGRTARHHDGNAGETLRFLKIATHGSASPTLVRLVSELRQMIDLRGPDREKILAATCSSNDAPAFLGIGTAEVSTFRRAGVLRGVLAIDEGRLQALFDRSELTSLAAGVDDRCGFDAMRSNLGISHAGVEQLAEMSLLDVQQHPFLLARYGVNQSTKASFAEFHRELEGQARPSLDEPTVTLAAAMKAVGGRLKPWGPTFARMIAGDLPYTILPGSSPLSSRILISKGDVGTVEEIAFIPNRPTLIAASTTMSKQDAAETLNLNWQQVSRLFDGLDIRRGTRSKSLLVATVLAASEQIITSAELAARRGVTLRAAYADAVRAGIPKTEVAGFCRASAEAAFFQGRVPGIGTEPGPDHPITFEPSGEHVRVSPSARGAPRIRCRTNSLSPPF